MILTLSFVESESNSSLSALSTENFLDLFNEMMFVFIIQFLVYNTRRQNNFIYSNEN